MSLPLSDTWGRAPRAECDGHKIGCFFEPLSSCVYDPKLAKLVPAPHYNEGQGSNHPGADRNTEEERRVLSSLPLLEKLGQMDQIIGLKEPDNPRDVFQFVLSGKALPSLLLSTLSHTHCVVLSAFATTLF